MLDVTAICRHAADIDAAIAPLIPLMMLFFFFFRCFRFFLFDAFLYVYRLRLRQRVTSHAHIVFAITPFALSRLLPRYARTRLPPIASRPPDMFPFDFSMRLSPPPSLFSSFFFLSFDFAATRHFSSILMPLFSDIDAALMHHYFAVIMRRVRLIFSFSSFPLYTFSIWFIYLFLVLR